MALVTTFTCSNCLTQVYELVLRDHCCSACRASKERAARCAHFAVLDDLPLETRVRRIEEALYDADVVRRLEALEGLTARY